MAHKPLLYISNTEEDCRVLEIQNISLWDANLPITNTVLKINLPNIDCDYIVPFPISGKGYYTTNTFGITNASCGQDLLNLPDGIYTITYSVCPNDQVFTTTSFLRVCQTRNLILYLLSNIFNAQPHSEKLINTFGVDVTKNRIQELKDLLVLLDTAKSDVRASKLQQGQDKLTYINTKLINY